jgi:hypothetical protein
MRIMRARLAIAGMRLLCRSCRSSGGGVDPGGRVLLESVGLARGQGEGRPWDMIVHEWR